MVDIFNVPNNTLLQDYLSIYDYKPNSLPTIVWSLKSTALGTTEMTRYFSAFLWCKNFKHENKIIRNTKNMWYKSNRNINISPYCTYLLTLCWTITNNHHGPDYFVIRYQKENYTVRDALIWILVPNRDIGIYASLLFFILRRQ